MERGEEGQEGHEGEGGEDCGRWRKREFEGRGEPVVCEEKQKEESGVGGLLLDPPRGRVSLHGRLLPFALEHWFIYLLLLFFCKIEMFLFLLQPA